MIKKTFSSILTALFIPCLISVQSIDFSADIQTKWAAGAPWLENDSTKGRFLIGDTSFAGKVQAYYGNSSAMAEGQVSYNALLNQLDFSLNELWLDYTSSFWGLRIGRQKTSWGKADGIDITNVICPKDMSSFSAMAGDDSSMAIDALRLSFTGNNISLDAYWIPFFTPSSLPVDQNNLLRKFIIPQSVTIPIQTESISTSVDAPILIDSFEQPEIAIWNGEYALKLSAYLSALDFSLYGFYGWDDIPLLDYTLSYSDPTESIPYSLPKDITVSGTYKRMGMIGADAALPIKETVLRVESAFFPMRHFQKSSESIMEQKQNFPLEDTETSEQRNELALLAGLDWMPEGWSFTAQYYCDVVFGNLDSLNRSDMLNHEATLNISKSLLSETLELSLSGVVSFNDFDIMINPSVNYKLSDQINLEGGALLFFEGPYCEGGINCKGDYGKYKDLSSFYINAKFCF